MSARRKVEMNMRRVINSNSSGVYIIKFVIKQSLQLPACPATSSSKLCMPCNGILIDCLSYSLPEIGLHNLHHQHSIASLLFEQQDPCPGVIRLWWIGCLHVESGYAGCQVPGTRPRARCPRLNSLEGCADSSYITYSVKKQPPFLFCI